MPALKTRKTASKPARSSKAKPASKVKRKVKALKARVARKVAKKAAPARRKTARKPKVQVVVQAPQTTITLGPHHVDRHPTEGFHVHPGPPLQPARQFSHSVMRHH